MMNATESGQLHVGSMKLAVPSCLIENHINQENEPRESRKSPNKNTHSVHYIIIGASQVACSYLLFKCQGFIWLSNKKVLAHIRGIYIFPGFPFFMSYQGVNTENKFEQKFINKCQVKEYACTVVHREILRSWNKSWGLCCSRSKWLISLLSCSCFDIKAHPDQKIWSGQCCVLCGSYRFFIFLMVKKISCLKLSFVVKRRQYKSRSGSCLKSSQAQTNHNFDPFLDSDN